jgi:hypothetical protein
VRLLERILKFLFPKTCHEIYLEGYAQGNLDCRAIVSYEKERFREEETLKLKIGQK